MKNSATWLLLISLMLTALVAPSFGQSPLKKRPKLKDFGSSLERLQWDAIKKQSVDSKPRKKASGGADEDVIQTETDLVTSDLLVVDGKGKLVSNLTAADFVIIEDGRPQEVAHFERGDNASVPRTIVLIIDYGCTQLPVLRRSIDAAKLLVGKLGPLDKMAIVTDDVELISDFTNDKKKLQKKLEAVYKKPNTAFDPTVVHNWHTWGKGLQYSALMAVLKEAFIEEDLRPIIIFQTDGSQVYGLRDPVVPEALPPDLADDFRAEQLKEISRKIKYRHEHRISDFSLDDVYRAVEKSRATIYTVVPEYRFLNRSLDQQVNLIKLRMNNGYLRSVSGEQPWVQQQARARLEVWRPTSEANLVWWAQQQEKSQDALAGVAARSGGWTEFLETPEDADGIYSRILADINHRYLVGYYPKNKLRDGARRRVKFEVRNHPEYHVLGRKSYYAPGPQ
ncbi:MAG TPA: VWA domain-containing protein [Pyrinomonadaceae bacterium]|nr:VWA domain-containing protein [Pyrinomonadaceae bacterium]